MDRNLRDRWVAALRSGHYPQAQGALNNENGFCCLGVLADVVDSSLWEDHDDGTGEKTWQGCRLELEEDILEELGVTGSEQSTLIALNDGCSQSTDYKPAQPFSVIADFIEATL